MSLKVTQSPVIQEWKKEGAGNLLFGLQKAQFEWLLPIHEAYYGSSSSVSSITLNELTPDGNFVAATSLATNLISYDVATAQYLTDGTKDISLSEGLYEIVFVNADSKIFTTEPFIIDNDANTPWILADGVWNNNGIWNNSKIWQTI